MSMDAAKSKLSPDRKRRRFTKDDELVIAKAYSRHYPSLRAAEAVSKSTTSTAVSVQWDKILDEVNKQLAEPFTKKNLRSKICKNKVGLWLHTWNFDLLTYVAYKH